MFMRFDKLRAERQAPNRSKKVRKNPPKRSGEGDAGQS
jgi:hypothetical protein